MKTLLTVFFLITIVQSGVSQRTIGRFDKLAVDTLNANVIITDETSGMIVLRVPHWAWYIAAVWWVLSIAGNVLNIRIHFLNRKLERLKRG